MQRTRIRPARHVRNIVGDAVLLLWVLLWYFVGRAARGVVTQLSEPIRHIGDTTDSLATRVSDAADSLGEIALVGDALAGPFRSIATTLQELGAQSEAQLATIDQLGTFLFVVVWLMPSMTYALLYVPRRIRRATEAAQARRYIDERADLDLFALRAMANAPMSRLATISDDPVAAWRTGNKQVIDQLADLELRRVGIGMLSSRADE